MIRPKYQFLKKAHQTKNELSLPEKFPISGFVMLWTKLNFKKGASLRSKRSSTRWTKLGRAEGVIAFEPREKWGKSKRKTPLCGPNFVRFVQERLLRRQKGSINKLPKRLPECSNQEYGLCSPLISDTPPSYWVQLFKGWTALSTTRRSLFLVDNCSQNKSCHPMDSDLTGG